MTDPEMADVTYIEPITWKVVERIIAKERPDAILPTMGGQTALNCALDLHNNGVLKQYNVELIGASPEAIDKAEDRSKFKDAMTKIGLGSARSGVAPISSTLYLSRMPWRCRSSAQFSAVWPPMVGRIASGFSLAMIFSTTCQVIGSM